MGILNDLTCFQCVHCIQDTEDVGVIRYTGEYHCAKHRKGIANNWGYCNATPCEDFEKRILPPLPGQCFGAGVEEVTEIE